MPSTKTKPFPVSPARVRKSPFRSPAKVRETLKSYKKGKKIGFTYVSSLKAMGLLPRANGKYQLGPKYT